MKVDFSASIKEMEPIETKYKRYWFRSRLEARWAVFFENIGARWAYEVQGFRLGYGDKNVETSLYLPDFYIENVETPWNQSTAIWVEIKGVMKDKSKDKCKRLAIESECPVLLIQGDPVDEDITLFRKHTPTQSVKFCAQKQGIGLIKARTSSPSQMLIDAQEKARSKRFGK